MSRDLEGPYGFTWWWQEVKQGSWMPWVLTFLLNSLKSEQHWASTLAVSVYGTWAGNSSDDTWSLDSGV